MPLDLNPPIGGLQRVANLPAVRQREVLDGDRRARNIAGQMLEFVALGQAKRVVGRLRFESDGRRQRSYSLYVSANSS